MALTSKQNAAGIGLLLFCLLLLPLIIWGLLYDLSNQHQLVKSGNQLIIHSSMHGLAFGGGIFCLVLIVWIATRLIIHKFNVLALPSEKKLNRVFSGLLLVSFVLMPLGYYGVSHYWENQMAAKGYQSCPASTLLFTRVTYSAWTLNPALCYDSDVKRLVTRGSWNESDQVEQVLEQRTKQQEARRQFLLQEEQLKRSQDTQS
ncbi:hypothetical protein [Arsukibacterium sp.]|uniref:hypothetical protein n=1 Tax=Arsukibacterium sp. TaxID=1977258 RepID=UPI0035649BC4